MPLIRSRTSFLLSAYCLFIIAISSSPFFNASIPAYCTNSGRQEGIFSCNFGSLERQRLKKLAQEGHFSYDVAFAVMGEEKKDELDKVVIKNDTLRKYFPRSYTPKQMEDTIIKLLEQWQRKQQRQNER